MRDAASHTSRAPRCGYFLSGSVPAHEPDVGLWPVCVFASTGKTTLQPPMPLSWPSGGLERSVQVGEHQAAKAAAPGSSPWNVCHARFSSMRI